MPFKGRETLTGDLVSRSRSHRLKRTLPNSTWTDRYECRPSRGRDERSLAQYLLRAGRTRRTQIGAPDSYKFCMGRGAARHDDLAFSATQRTIFEPNGLKRYWERIRGCIGKEKRYARSVALLRCKNRKICPGCVVKFGGKFNTDDPTKGKGSCEHQCPPFS